MFLQMTLSNDPRNNILILIMGIKYGKVQSLLSGARWYGWVTAAPNAGMLLLLASRWTSGQAPVRLASQSSHRIAVEKTPHLYIMIFLYSATCINLAA